MPLTSKPMRDTGATLTFDQTGTQTLHANFTDWYEINAIKDVDGKNQLVVLNPDKTVVVDGRDYKPVYNPVTDSVALVDFQYQPKITDENGANTDGNIG